MDGSAVKPPKTAKPGKAKDPLKGLPSIHEATAAYEAWLGEHMRLVPEDLDTKHERMKAAAFPFLRATFYRWMQLWPRLCPELLDAPKVLAVGDLHIENFGTWRDAEGRLIWGCNDFDEAYPLPYTLDLVRLTASALLAVREGVVDTPAEHVCAIILKGYRKGLESGARPYVLGEKNEWLRELAMAALRDPVRFADKMKALPRPSYRIGERLRETLSARMPEEGLPISYRHRVAGLGSLGRRRVVALARWYGGVVVREAKPLTPSVCTWAAGRGSDRLYYDEIVNRAERCPDPYVGLQGKWIVRRLAADAASIDIDKLPRGKEKKLFAAMGHETANVHIGSARKTILRDLDDRPEGWLSEAAERMAEATIRDWETYRAEATKGAPSES